jgi:hypothetical protein
VTEAERTKWEKKGIVRSSGWENKFGGTNPTEHGLNSESRVPIESSYESPECRVQSKAFCRNHYEDKGTKNHGFDIFSKFWKFSNAQNFAAKVWFSLSFFYFFEMLLFYLGIFLVLGCLLKNWNGLNGFCSDSSRKKCSWIWCKKFFSGNLLSILKIKMISFFVGIFGFDDL